MAIKKKTPEKLNYSAELQKLKEMPPQRLYVLYGPEDYLRDYYLDMLKKKCLLDEEDSFSYRRINEESPSAETIREAVDAVPFLSERTLVELHGIDINRLKDTDKFIEVFSDIPDYCTLVMILDSEYEPDKRLKLIKFLQKKAAMLCFAEQDEGKLLNWIRKRFEAYGKSIELEAARRLIFLCGNLMNKLIPEIDKIAAFVKTDRVSLKDVNEIAVPVPDAVVFQMTEFIAEKRFNTAFDILHDLIAEGQEPIMILAMLGAQIRNLYAARLALNYRLGAGFLLENSSIKYEMQARQTMRAAEKFSEIQLRRAAAECARADYRMKSSGEESESILVDLLVRIAAEK